MEADVGRSKGADEVVRMVVRISQVDRDLVGGEAGLPGRLLKVLGLELLLLVKVVLRALCACVPVRLKARKERKRIANLVDEDVDILAGGLSNQPRRTIRVIFFVTEFLLLTGNENEDRSNSCASPSLLPPIR